MPRASRTWRQFFKTYYAPNNAVLTLVGDFKSPEAIEKNQEILRKHFGAARATAGGHGRARANKGTHNDD